MEIGASTLLPNVVRPCCREAAALRGARHAKRGGRRSRAAAAPRAAIFIEMGHNVRQVHSSPSVFQKQPNRFAVDKSGKLSV